MPVKAIELENFRNFKHLQCEFSEGTNIISGKNAQGKTNLTEAIFYFSSLKSFRGVKEENLITFGSNYANLRESLTGMKRDFILDISLRKDGKRALLVNGVQMKKAADMIGIIPAVTFTPDDLSIVKSDSSIRRKMVDFPLCQLYPRYLSDLSKYNQVLKVKRLLLKEEVQKDYSLCETYNAQLAHYGTAVMTMRRKYIENLASLSSEIYSDIAGENETLSISYKTVSVFREENSEQENERLFFDHLCELMNREFEIASPLSGIHRDDVIIEIGERGTKGCASQGQMRSIALALKLSEREILKSKLDEAPLLILDDILSELDSSRQDYVLNHINGGQIFITCCDDSPFTRIKGGSSTCRIEIEAGQIAKKEII